MLAYLLRPSNYAPSPVTAICSNDISLVVFRKNGSVQMLDSITYKKYLFLNFFYNVVQAQFINLNTVIALTICGKIIIFDVSTLDKKVLDLGAKTFSAEYHNLTFSEVLFYYTNNKNELLIFKNSKSTLVSSIKSTVSCIYSCGNYIFVCTCDGWIRVFQNGKLENEIEIKTKAMQITRYDNTNYVVAGENGNIYMINPISDIVVDKIYVRDHPLNVLCVLDERIHTSGVDSRISCLDVVNNKLVRTFQGDPHSNEVLCMVVDNKRIITSGEDCVVVVSKPEKERYKAERILDSSLLVGESKDYCWTAFERRLDLYYISGITNNVVEQNNPHNENICFKVDTSILERINQPLLDVSHFLSVNSKDIIISATISYDQRYLAYSTTTRTYLYALFRGSKLCMEKMKTFPPAKKLIFNFNKLVSQEFSKTIKIFDLNTFEEDEITYEDFKEEICLNDSCIILPCSHQIYNIKNKILSSMFIEGVFKTSYQSCFNFSEDEKEDKYIRTAIIISENEDFVIKTMIEDDKIEDSVSISKDVQSINTYQPSPIFRNILYFTGYKTFANDRFLFVVDEDVATYEMGHLIHGIATYNGDIVVVQTNYKHCSANFKKCVFKEKYSNK